MYVEFYHHSDYPFFWSTAVPTFFDLDYLFRISIQNFSKLLGTSLEQIDIVVEVKIVHVGTTYIVEHSILISCAVNELCYLNGKHLSHTSYLIRSCIITALFIETKLHRHNQHVLLR